MAYSLWFSDKLICVLNFLCIQMDNNQLWLVKYKLLVCPDTERKGRGSQLLHFTLGTRQAWVRKHLVRQVSKASACWSEDQKGNPRALESPRDNVERKKRGRASPQSWSEMSSGSPSSCACVDLILTSQALRPELGPRRPQEAHPGQIQRALLSSKDRCDTAP